MEVLSYDVLAMSFLRTSLFLFKTFTLLLFLLSFTLACSWSAPEVKTFKIGLVAPTSGEGFSEGYRMVYAARQAVREWNDTAAPGGYSAELVVYDEADEDVAEKLALDPQVVAVAGYLDASKAVRELETYSASGQPLVVVGMGRELPEAPGYENALWMSPQAKQTARAVAEFAKSGLRGARTHILAGPGPANRAYVQTLRAVMETAGVVVENTDYLTTPMINGHRLAGRLAAVDSNLVLLAAGFPASAEIAKAVKAGRNAQVMVTVPIGPEFGAIAGDKAAGVYHVALAAIEETERGETFAGEFLSQWKTRPTPLASQTYDAVGMLLKLVSAAEKTERRITRETVLRRLPLTDTYEGVTGVISFDESGRRSDPKLYFYRLTAAGFPGDLVASMPAGH